MTVSASWLIGPAGGTDSPPVDPLDLLGGPRPPPGPTRSTLMLGRAGAAADPSADLAAYHALRRQAFCVELGLYDGDDRDEYDADPATVVLIARELGQVVGGVRLHPLGDPLLGAWRGGRLAVAAGRRGARGGAAVGALLVRAACATAEDLGALRFDADVLDRNVPFFRQLGWMPIRPVDVRGAAHTRMRWPIGRLASAAVSKQALGPLLAGLRPGGVGWVGDDGAPVPGSDVVASVDGILPSMVERDPEWAGWCGILVGANDLAAMGAAPSGALDALAAPDAAHARRVLAGLRAAADAFGLPLLGGHTQLGVPAALSVTALGRTSAPVPGSGGRSGHEVRLTADLGGGWRPGYTGRQWDSTSHRTGTEIAAMLSAVGAALPAAAKDVSMAGLVGSLGMLAEASGVGAEVYVDRVPRPPDVGLADWLTCFPGFGMLTAADPGTACLAAGPATGAVCGRLVAGSGVTLVWPDGERTAALEAGVTGLGTAGSAR